jgi:glutathione peroxidase
MKLLYPVLALILLTGFGLFARKAKKCELVKEITPSQSFFDLSATDINGKKREMSEFKGKYILVVNTASKCGYTVQYKELEELSKKYSSKLVVLGFPTNDFLWQEPGTNAEIKEFCSLKFGVTFPMFEKTTTKGKNKHEIYQWLTDKTLNGWNKTKPSWNFNKYLISPDGKLLQHFGSGVKPLSPKITNLIK